MNSRVHWRVKSRDTKYWDYVIAVFVGNELPISPLKKAKLKLTRFSPRPLDWDNLATSFKNPVDALVACGVLEDDNLSVIGIPEFEWIKSTKKEQRIRIEITEL